jgi:8-oxo-dGTP diphosphatase
VKEQRRYPGRPLVGAGAVVHRTGKVLLVKRRNSPNQGRWALPGGLVELGETTEGAAEREVLEETGLRVAIEGLIDVQTDIHKDSVGEIEYHFVLVDYSALSESGDVTLNQESSEYGWFSELELKDLDMSQGTRKVLGRFFASSGHSLR